MQRWQDHARVAPWGGRWRPHGSKCCAAAYHLSAHPLRVHASCCIAAPLQSGRLVRLVVIAPMRFQMLPFHSSRGRSACVCASRGRVKQVCAWAILPSKSTSVTWARYLRNRTNLSWLWARQIWAQFSLIPAHLRKCSLLPTTIIILCAQVVLKKNLIRRLRNNNKCAFTSIPSNFIHHAQST